MGDFVSNFQNAFGVSRQRRLEDEAMARQSQLGQLVGQSLTAPVTARDSYLGQIAGLDPNAALTLSTRFQSEAQAQREAEQARVQNMARLLSAARDPAIQASIYANTLRPALQGMGFDAPEQWDAQSLMPVVQQLGGVGQEGPQSAQRAYVEWMAAQVPEEEREEFFRVQAGLAPRAQLQRYNIQRTDLDTGEVRYDRIPTLGGAVGGMPPAAPQPSGGMSIPVPGGQIDIADPAAAEFLRNNPSVMQGLSSGQPFTTTAGAPTQAQLDANAQRTIDSQTFGAPAQAAPMVGGGVTPAGQATNETRAAAAAAQAAAVARETARAGSAVQREIDAPKTIEEGQRLISYIDAIIADPNRELVTGGSGIFNPLAWPGIDRVTGAADTRLRIAQVQGNAFLQAFESLKGGGAITEIEGQKAEQAIARLSTAQSDEGFLKALQDFREAIAPGIERARARIQGGAQPAAPDAAAPENLPPGARQAPDGNFYVQQGGRWFRVEQ